MLYRGERWNVSYGVESAYGESPTSIMTATNLFGVFDEATLPDPEFDHTPYWFQNAANRTYNMAYKGKARSSGSIPDIILLDGKPLFLPLANAIVHTGGPTYVHTISNTSDLSSMRLVATNFPETGSTAGLCRWFVGGKVNRATFHCEEGDMLKMSLDEIIFKMPYYVEDDGTQISPFYDVDAIKQTLSLPTTEPYYFSMGTIKMKFASNALTEETIYSVKNFRLEVNNNIEPKYYIATNTEKVPYELREGKREYRLAMTVDLVDNSGGSFDKNDIFLELLNQGASSGVIKGAAVSLTFTRGANDSIVFTTPASGTPGSGAEAQGSLVVRAPMNIVTEGVVSVPMEMICRDLQVVVTDSVAGASYPV